MDLEVDCLAAEGPVLEDHTTGRSVLEVLVSGGRVADAHKGLYHTLEGHTFEHCKKLSHVELDVAHSVLVDWNPAYSDALRMGSEASEEVGTGDVDLGHPGFLSVYRGTPLDSSDLG